jgi:IS5 family transposase
MPTSAWSTHRAWHDVVESNTLLHGQETQAWGDAGYQGTGKRPDAKDGVRWNIAMRPGERKLLDRTLLVESLTDQIERIKASIRAKSKHSTASSSYCVRASHGRTCHKSWALPAA